MSEGTGAGRAIPQRYALAPLAVAPGALLLALLLPAGLDPVHPFETLPPGAWLLLLLAAAGPAATIATARAAFKDDPDGRRRALLGGAVGLVVAVLVAGLVGLPFADPLMVKGGWAFGLLALAVVGLGAACGALAALPRSRFCWGLLVGELLVANVTRAACHTPKAPEEWVRLAMVIAPGWGKETLGSVAFRQIPASLHDPRTVNEAFEKRLRAVDAALETAERARGFEGAEAAWLPDERVVRGWVEQRIGNAPDLPDPARREALTGAVTHYLAFAEDPAAKLHPWTTGGILGAQALADTEDVTGATPEERDRVAISWYSLKLLELELTDPELEKRAVACIRKTFEEGKLDRGSLIYLETYSLELRRRAEAGDGPGYLALLERWQSGDWPDAQKKAFARQAEFVRKYPEQGYAPVMLLVLSRIQADYDIQAAKASLLSVLKSWPDAPVAGLAREELARLPATPVAP